jgi:hypothetical protein
VAVEIRHEGGTEVRLRAWLGGGVAYRPQGPGDLGARMGRALRAAFRQGAERAVIIGSDIPALGAAVVDDAFEALHRHDLVFGPAADGGYYLIGATAAGFRRAAACLAAGIDWGSGRVLSQSLERVRPAGLTFALLERLADVDRPEDLPGAMAALNAGADPQSVSVIVPALDEAGAIAGTLAAAGRHPGVEVVVADGGSRDGTAIAAAAAGALVMAARPPRSVQMNAGAAAASGGILLFLHADTHLPRDFPDQVRQTLAGPGVAAGAFRLRIDSNTAGLRLIELVANWRARVLQMPYGDQALFLPRQRFWGLGGFPALCLMEDYELVRRLKRRGRIALARGCATTSARRWVKLGIAKTWLINQMVVAAYHFGVPTDHLSAWYRSKSR